MNELLNVDNPFFRGVSKVIDCVVLSMLWLFFCIPVVTAGASTTALYYAVNKSVKNERGYVAAEFFAAFKANFKQATVIWLILMGIYALLGFDYYVMKKYAEAGITLGKIYIVFEGFAILVTLWAFYIFPYIARFENTTKNILKNSALMALSNLPWTVLISVIFILMFVVIYYVPAVAVAVPAFYNLLKNVILEKVFIKYMTPEDIELEEERNRVFYN